MDAPTVKKEDEEAKAEPALAQAIKKSKKKKKLMKLTPKQKALVNSYFKLLILNKI